MVELDNIVLQDDSHECTNHRDSISIELEGVRENMSEGLKTKVRGDGGVQTFNVCSH